MATSYLNKTAVHDILVASNLSDSVITQILKGLGGKTGVVELPSTSTVTALDVAGSKIAIVSTPPDTSTPVIADLSAITKAEIKVVQDLVFNTDNNVTLTLGSDTNKVAFAGVVSTGGGADEITIVSTKGVYVSSGAGNDTVTTGAGNDTVTTGTGDDSVTTGAGNDSVSAGAGNDTIDTGAGNDSVSTGTGNDSVETGAGNDSVYVGSGSDTVNTGAGVDIVKLAAGFTGDAHLDGGEGKAGEKDTLDLRLVNITSVEDLGGSKIEFTITLDDGSKITASHFEKFIYDSSTADVDGSIQIVGIDDFLHNFPAVS